MNRIGYWLGYLAAAVVNAPRRRPLAPVIPIAATPTVGRMTEVGSDSEGIWGLIEMDEQIAIDLNAEIREWWSAGKMR